MDAKRLCSARFPDWLKAVVALALVVILVLLLF
jgi:hypothetical protein